MYVFDDRRLFPAFAAPLSDSNMAGRKKAFTPAVTLVVSKFRIPRIPEARCKKDEI